MKKIFLTLIILFCSIHFINGQNNKVDTLKIGRVCKLVLYNGFQTEGKITERNNDTLTFQTDITNLFIPVKDIKFVLNPEIELSDLEESDSLDYNKISEPIVKIDTTAECDVYFDNRSVLNDVNLIEDTDSTLKAIRNDKAKIIKIAGIRKIVFKASAPFGKGFLYGALTGFGFGFFALAFQDSHGESIGGIGAGVVFGLVCAIPGGLIGGVIGVLASSDDVYLFDNGISQMKIKRIKFALEKHY